MNIIQMKLMPVTLFAKNSKGTFFKQKLHNILNDLSSCHYTSIRTSDNIYTRKFYEHLENNGYIFQKNDKHKDIVLIKNPHLRICRVENGYLSTFLPIQESNILSLPELEKKKLISSSDVIIDEIVDTIPKNFSNKYLLDAKTNALNIISNIHAELISICITNIEENFGKNLEFNFLIHGIPYHYKEVYDRLDKDLRDAGYKLNVYFYESGLATYYISV